MVGKTCLLRKILENGAKICATAPHVILYCYGIIQDTLLEMEISIPGLILHKGLPSEETIDTLSDGRFNILVLDDLQDKLSSNPYVELLYTQGANHMNWL